MSTLNELIHFRNEIELYYEMWKKDQMDTIEFMQEMTRMIEERASDG